LLQALPTGQGRQTLEEMLSELPKPLHMGMKMSTQGHGQHWCGYKLHLDVADGQISISCLLTAAILDDSQVAIPLATITAQRVTSLYDLRDAAYDAKQIREHMRSLGHVPLTHRTYQDSLSACDKRREQPTSVRSNRHSPNASRTFQNSHHDRTCERTAQG